MAEQGSQSIPVGKHLLDVSGDSLFFILRGVLTLSEAETFFGHVARVRREHGRAFVLYDARQSTGVEPPARHRAVMDHQPEEVPNLQVAFGVSFMLRAIIGMLTRANTLLRRDAAPAIQMFENENEARAFFERERTTIRGA